METSIVYARAGIQRLSPQRSGRTCVYQPTCMCPIYCSTTSQLMEHTIQLSPCDVAGASDGSFATLFVFLSLYLRGSHRLYHTQGSSFLPMQPNFCCRPEKAKQDELFAVDTQATYECETKRRRTKNRIIISFERPTPVLRSIHKTLFASADGVATLPKFTFFPYFRSGDLRLHQTHTRAHAHNTVELNTTPRHNTTQNKSQQRPSIQSRY
jgi:hypothetical protein